MANSVRFVDLEADGSVPVTIVSGGGTGGTASSFGAAFPPTGTAVGFIDSGGNMAGGTLDASGFLKVNVAAGSSGNAAASATGAAVPADADYGGINVAGTLRGATGVNPSGSVYAQQVDLASLNGVSLSSTVPVSGTVTAAQATASSLNATVVGTGTFAVQISSALPAGTNVIGHVIADTGSTTAVTGNVTVVQGTASNLKAQVTGAGTAGTADTGVQTIQGIASMTPVQVSQATASSLNATVVGTGTFATQAAITAASGAIASGAIASGAVASGAFASGSIAVGAIAAGATSIADNEDVASGDGDRGVKILVTRKATPANTSGTDGDYEFLQVSNGRLWTQGTNVRIYGGSVTLTTTNWVSLANGSGWQSVGITTNGNDIQFVLTTKSTGTAYADFYIAEELSNGSAYTDGATGTEGTFTAANRLNSRYLGSIRTNNGSATAAFKLSDIFGVMPAKVALIGINNTGASISSTAGDTVFTYETAA